MTVKEAPALVIYYADGESWKGIPLHPNIMYSSLKSMVDNFIFMRTNRGQRTKFYSRTVKEIKEENDIKVNCVHKDKCIIAFVDASPKDGNLNKFNEIIGRLEFHQRDPKLKDINMLWVNATCHSEFAKSFGIDVKRESGLVFYYPYRKTYCKFSGVVDDYMIADFLDRARQDRYPQNDIETNLVTIKSHQCDDGTAKEVNQSIVTDYQKTDL